MKPNYTMVKYPDALVAAVKACDLDVVQYLIEQAGMRPESAMNPRGLKLPNQPWAANDGRPSSMGIRPPPMKRSTEPIEYPDWVDKKIADYLNLMVIERKPTQHMHTLV